MLVRLSSLALWRLPLTQCHVNTALRCYRTSSISAHSMALFPMFPGPVYSWLFPWVLRNINMMSSVSHLKPQVSRAYSLLQYVEFIVYLTNFMIMQIFLLFL